MLESFKKTFVRGREKQGKTDAASHNAGNAAAAEAIAARGGADAGKAECSHPPPGVANPTAPIRPDPNKEIAEENLSHFAEPPLMLSSDISGHEKQVLFISTGAANTRPVRGPRRDEDEDEEEGDEGEEEEGEEEDEEEELADKLHLLFDFNDPKELEEDKEYNRRFLLELVDYVNCGTMKFNEAVFKDITRMLEINLFRPLPPSAPAMSGSEPKNPKEEDPTMEAAWSHLQIVYELLKYVVFNETDQRLKLFVDQQFILKLLNLFDSEDPRERDYLKSILHRIYLKFMDHRQFIRKAINDIFDQFIESERHNGIAELLELLGSFVNGFVLPLEEEHTQSLERVLVPLHKLECVSMYHKQLSFCITQFVEKDPKLADLVLRGLLKFWPLTNSQKEVLFLGELEKILELTQAPEFQMVMTPLFQQIARCLSSPHSEVARRVLFLGNNDYIVRLVAQNRTTILPLIFPALDRNARSHQNEAVRGLSINVCSKYFEMDQALYDLRQRHFFHEDEALAAALAAAAAEAAAAPSSAAAEGAAAAAAAEGLAAGAAAAGRGQRACVVVEMEVAQPYACREFSLAELATATGEWAEGNRIGSGAFGVVYKGVSPHDGNQAWAVKRARVLTNDFQREVKGMASKHHPHLVRLLGYCIDFDPSTRTMEQLLVYELMPNGDLDRWIGPGVSNPLSLQQRLDVLIGVAKGLLYLHDFNIVHRDIKPANILLDGKMQAKVADFGLVKLLGGTSVATSEAATRLVGTLGYMDPEYCSSHKPSPAVDVYSFGLVMLVVLTGREAVLVVEGDHVNIKRWVAPLVISGAVAEFKDPRLEAPDELVLCLARLALSCTALPGASRPSMLQVLAELVRIKQEMFGAQVSAEVSGIDTEIGGSDGPFDFSAEMARAMREAVSHGSSTSMP